jgi:hypothetical protein
MTRGRVKIDSTQGTQGRLDLAKAAARGRQIRRRLAVVMSANFSETQKGRKSKPPACIVYS